ncbi:MAG: deoxyguanosinetriphosphate triphosphohydrolase [candidate division Zixibacteria bacterium HGW-Zixibacteria-1]|nr:MAG: deoxyguanosinetriphosphate triphosphohydrolase [candidate division Zixibacteria bacterium HGW-Zixibacteria-1]
MLTPRERLEEYERKILAPYACFSSKSRGRHYPQSEHPIRTAFQRDRDRVIHSAAFRRMEYKTQVFVNHEGDHYRTRLTHSIEVAQISRTIARALGLNEDLSEAIALVHDLGHTPFGHSGEDVLNELMRDFGGFNHNRQSLRVVDILERRYPEHPGLNLTYEVREGIVKHESHVEPIMPDIFPPGEKPTLEAALVDLADSIAYNSHDIDDGLSSGILEWGALEDVPIWVEARRESEKLYPDLTLKRRRHSIVRFLVDRQVTDLINESFTKIERHQISSLDDVRHAPVRLVDFSDEMRYKLGILKKFLNEKMYHHPRMLEIAGQARMIIEMLFAKYRVDPENLHGKYKLRVGHEPLEIIISDFIAGMTDRYAYKIYEQLK